MDLDNIFSCRAESGAALEKTPQGEARKKFPVSNFFSVILCWIGAGLCLALLMVVAYAIVYEFAELSIAFIF